MDGMWFGAACVPWQLQLARSNIMQMSCKMMLLCMNLDQGMLEQSVYTTKMGVFKLSAHCCADALGWDYVEVVVACCIVVCHIGCCGHHD